MQIIVMMPAYIVNTGGAIKLPGFPPSSIDVLKYAWSCVCRSQTFFPVLYTVYHCLYMYIMPLWLCKHYV